MRLWGPRPPPDPKPPERSQQSTLPPIPLVIPLEAVLLQDDAGAFFALVSAVGVPSRGFHPILLLPNQIFLDHNEIVNESK